MRSIRFLNKHGWIFAVFTFIINVTFYKALPETVAIQWQFNGNISNTASKLQFIFILPLIQTIIYIIKKIKAKGKTTNIYNDISYMFVSMLLLIVDTIIILINLKVL
jgi:uncharacterized membrane protein